MLATEAYTRVCQLTLEILFSDSDVKNVNFFTMYSDPITSTL